MRTRPAKILSALCAMLLGALANQAFAGCAAEGYTRFRESTANNVRNLLNGKRVDATAPASAGSENWKEDHCGTTDTTPGNLYKVGDGTPVDPRVPIGTWQPVDINGGGTNGWRVRYSYTGGPSYTWRVYRNGTNNNVGIGICWEDEAGNTIATSPTTTAAGPCP